MLVALTLSCGREHIGSTKWKRIESASDSAVMQLENMLQKDFYNHNSAMEAIRKLDSVASKSSSRQIKARAAYWHSYHEYENDHIEESKKFVKEALAYGDSARYPYDNARMHALQTQSMDMNMEKVRILGSTLSYFLENNDSIMIQNIYTQIGVMYAEMVNWEEADHNFEMATNYTRPRTFRRFSNLFNRYVNATVAKKFGNRGQDAKIYELADSLYADPIFDLSPSMIRAQVYKSKYDKTGDKNWLLRIDTVSNPPRWQKFAVRAWLAQYYLKHNRIDSASQYVNLLIPQVHTGEFAYREDGIKAIRDYYDVIGKKDSASAYDKEFQQLNSITFHQAQEYMDMANVLSANEKEQIHSLLTLQYKKSYGWIWCLVIIIVLVCSGVIWWMKSVVSKRHKTREKELEQALETESRRRAVSELKNEELVNNENGSQPKIATNDNNWEMVKATYSEIDPNFAKKLCTRYPNLTPGEVRLACFTWMGMEYKHIASLMNITPSSVMKNRYRLRSKLGLKRDQHLATFLHNLMND